MSTYHFSQIHYKSKQELKQLDDLLATEGIQRDANLDYTVGLFDEDYHLVATGSCFENTLRCLAVDHNYQGEGLLNQVVSHLIEFQYQRGNVDLFLYTKCETALFFRSLGFYEIARVDDKLVFMENRRDGFSNYLKNLISETTFTGDAVGAIVMNANPFTLGHQYLIETAASQCDVLHLFVVSEDVSLVPFEVRYQLIKEGTAHLSNIVYHKTESYMISTATFPSYFLKDSDIVIQSHAKLDLAIFAQIAKALNITKRFVGSEPFSVVTNIYNNLMKEALQHIGIDCHIIERKESGNEAISASRVRQLIHDGDLEQFEKLVPASTYRFFASNEAKPVIEAIRSAKEVIHY